ncbi:MAG: penicillin-insensitive murein endopeptidase [Polyangiales bacterium]
MGRPRPASLLLALLAAATLCLSLPSLGLADPRRPTPSGATRNPGVRRRPPARPASASCGYANRGSLDHGRALRESASLRFLPGRTLHFGTDELVGLLERSARGLHRRFRARLTVGDLSARCGGPAAQHRSHQSGRDADVAFFVRRVTRRGVGAPVELTDYVVFDGQGRNADGTLAFDTARNWAFIEAVLTDTQARAARVFVSSPLRALLLRWAREHGASPHVIELAANTLVQPARVSPHDNHFHVHRVPRGRRRVPRGRGAPSTSRAATRAAPARRAPARRSGR